VINISLTLQPLQFLVGLLVVIVPVGFVYFLLRNSLRKMKIMCMVAAVILAGICGGAVFVKIYSETQLGDNIRDREGRLIHGYYHNYSVFKSEKNYDELNRNTKDTWDNIYYSEHEIYMNDLEHYRTTQRSRLVYSIAGLVAGGLISMIYVCCMGFAGRRSGLRRGKIMRKIHLLKPFEDERLFD